MAPYRPANQLIERRSETRLIDRLHEHRAIGVALADAEFAVTGQEREWRAALGQKRRRSRSWSRQLPD
jgi:hypothetical protein